MTTQMAATTLMTMDGIISVMTKDPTPEPHGGAAPLATARHTDGTDTRSAALRPQAPSIPSRHRPSKRMPFRNLLTLAAGVGAMLGALTFGSGAGHEAAVPRTAVRAALSGTPATRAQSEGLPASLEARLVPERIVRSGRGGAMTVSLELRTDPSFHTGRWVMGLYRADGTPVDTQRSSNFSITDGTVDHEIALPELPDGYYVARATVVATSGSEDGSSVAELFLEVHDGDIDLLETNDWLTRSGAIDARRSLL